MSAINTGAVVRSLAILSLSPLLLTAQFSPGALSKPHQSFEGPTHCTSCHVGAGGDRRFRCTTCHREIAQRLAEDRGLHPSLTAKSHGDDSCVKCHSEHNGKDFVPILWNGNPDDFDHRRAGYPLEGAHAGLACSRCHTPGHIAPAARRLIQVKDLRRTYLGLTRECLACHQDEHAGQLGTNCERCHTVSRWKDVTRFDHSTAKFILTGAHQRVLCAKCHAPVAPPAGGKPRVRFTGIAFAQCASCHQDPHKGSFTVSCSGCHTDLAWKPARNLASTFDHTKTKFPLLGKHVLVACEKCHRTADFKAPVAHLLCKSCHEDRHGGQFLARSDGGDCAACHTAADWKQSTFTVAGHAHSPYPLAGRHATVPCAGCHKPAGVATVYRTRHDLCTDCHKDAHAAQFARAPLNNHCELCHTVDQFRPARFTLARHEQTNFPLRGAHAAVSCADCHTIRPDGRNVIAYRFADLACAGCHFDPHRGQFASRMTSAAGCESCHNVRTWHDVSSFDHANTRFALTGAHSGVPCDQCHRATALGVGLKRVSYRDTPRACAACHQDPHAGQFAATAGTEDCAACHATVRWRPARFNHDRTNFRLAGAHAQVPCAACHKNRKEVNALMVVFYKPTPQECSGCHGPNIAN